ncbi:MAG: hypothetical protein NUV48_07090 [Peptococcaceae bacterium]|nr:hypothetical protein [Peptococcaceae bacterium]
MIGIEILYNKKPLFINMDLAQFLGLHEAVVLQQIHYWLKENQEENRGYRDGHYWINDTITQLESQFPFWSKPTIVRILGRLEKKGVLVKDKLDKNRFDHALSYRINYVRLEEIVKAATEITRLR